MRLLSSLAHALGWSALLAIAAGLVLLVLAGLRATVFHTPAPSEREAEKAAYLAAVPPAPRDAPNFVVILFDDLGWGDLSSYGNPLIRTPRIDRLGEEGVRMTHFYSAAPVCTPSRAALLTGRYPIRSGTHRYVFFADGHAMAYLRRAIGWNSAIPADEILLPEALGAAGYATGMVGKWHLGSAPGHLPNDLGFDFYYGVLWSNDMQPLHVYRNREIEIFDDTDRQPMGVLRDEDTRVSVVGTDQTKLTQDYTREAIAFLQAQRGRPFFLYVAHTFPHVPHFPSREHVGGSQGGRYGDVVEDLDRSTGAILDALERLGHADDTLVIVTSDNGADHDGSPGPLRGRKGQNWEGGQRVPLLARWPGHIPAGQVSDAMAMNIDFFPTLLALAGIAPPTDRVIDGRDLMPTLAGGPSPHEWLFYFPQSGGPPEAVRDADFKYRRKTIDRGRAKDHLVRMDVEEESHNLMRKYPGRGNRLHDALTAMKRSLKTNPRGWR